MVSALLFSQAHIYIYIYGFTSWKIYKSGLFLQVFPVAGLFPCNILLCIISESWLCVLNRFCVTHAWILYTANSSGFIDPQAKLLSQMLSSSSIIQIHSKKIRMIVKKDNKLHHRSTEIHLVPFVPSISTRPHGLPNAWSVCLSLIYPTWSYYSSQLKDILMKSFSLMQMHYPVAPYLLQWLAFYI